MISERNFALGASTPWKRIRCRRGRSSDEGQAWIERNRPRLTVPVVSHLGAVLNFAAGTIDRAPDWLRKSGLEWLWRIKEEPMLWRRCFRDGLVLLFLLVTRVLPYAWYLRRHQPSMGHLDAATIETKEERREYVVRLRGAWTEQNLAPLRDCFSMAVLIGKDIKLEIGGVTYVDSAFVGLVQLLQGHQDHNGKELLIVASARRGQTCYQILLCRIPVFGHREIDRHRHTL
jgi:N-acetylglucosaminyldiphosphoundecaprenol N-acetyl-beta-D-mannosaminyltransferase